MKLKAFLKKRPAKFTPIRVRWVDSHTIIGWRNREAAEAIAAEGIVAESVGHFLGVVGKGDREGLAIAESRVVAGDDDVSEAIIFPLAVVIDIKVLK